MAELKKCPFCGSKAKVLNHYNEGTVEICCANEFGICYIAPHTEEGFHLHEVERDWNNRATEAEIRAKAIEEFAEKLKESLVKNYRHFITTDTDGFEWLTTDAVATHIDKVAEQLKEEA